MIVENAKNVTHSITLSTFIGLIFSGLAAISGVITAVLRFVAGYQIRREQSVWNEWFRRKWVKVQLTPWRGLPATVIAWLLRFRERLFEYQEGLGFVALASAFLIPLCLGTSLWISAQRTYPAEHVALKTTVIWLLVSLVYTAFAFLIVPGETRDLASFSVLVLPAFAYMQVASRNIHPDKFTIVYLLLSYSVVLMYLHYRFHGLRLIGWPTATLVLLAITYETQRRLPVTGHTLSTVSLFGISLVTTSVILKTAFVVSNEKGSSDRFQLFAMCLLAIFSFASVFVLYDFIQAMLLMTLPIAVLMAVLIIPVCGIITSGALQSSIGLASYRRNTNVLKPIDVRPNTSSTLVFIGISVGLSFLITLLALFLGHLLAPKALLPQKFQMLLSNVVCDSLTIIVTFFLLERSVGSQKRFSVRTAITLSLLAAAVLAATSLKAGLSFTPNKIPMWALVRVMVGRSIEGGRWQFGPYFWAMHTTFLPCLAFACVIFLAWSAKLCLRPLEWFLGRGATPEINPIGLTSALFGCFTAVFTLLATFVAVIRYWLT